MAWTVGQRHKNGAIIVVDGVEVSTGSATVSYRLVAAGGDPYLQSDGATVNSTPHSFAATYAAGEGFHHELIVPSSLVGVVRFYVVHSVHGAVYSEEHEVVTAAAADSRELQVKLVS